MNALEGNNSASGDGDVVAELADVMICCLVMMGRWFPDDDLIVAVDNKLRVLEDPSGTHKSSLAFRTD